MTKEMEYLMHLYACAAGSVGATPPEYPVDFEKLYELADRMSLLTMLSYALKISPKVDCPQEIKGRLFSAMLGTSLKNSMRIDGVLELLEDVEKRGIQAVVVKGLDCARFYSKPECRISADTDLFVREKDEETLLAYFQEQGYRVRRRNQEEHHSECFSPKTGMIEVHTKMGEDFVFGAMVKRVEGIRDGMERSVKASVKGTQISVLHPTDAMIFMTFHLVKHFIFGEASLKMAYDLALYYTHCKDQVDLTQYKAWLRSSGYETVISGLFSAMVRYCGFAKEDFEEVVPYQEEKGRVFGDSLEQYSSREDGNPLNYSMILEYCTTQGNIQKKGKVYTFLLNGKTVTAEKMRVLFPSVAHLKKSYPYLQKHPYLYPASCIHRFFHRGTQHVFHSAPERGRIFHYQENLHARLSEAEEKQVKLLKNMDLL